jgi:hypothetical protein
MLQWIQGEVDSSDELYLIQGCREPQKDKPPAPQTPLLPQYLSMVKTQKHTEALTSLLLSIHLLAVESEVETPEHALLACDAPIEVKSLREVFLEILFTDAPSLRRRMVELNHCIPWPRRQSR